MRNEVMNLKRHVYRATGISLLILLFGALGAGFLFVVGNLFGVQILKPGSAISEMLWHLFFWATDFFFVAFVLVLSYLIAGLPAVAPALTLSVLFSHFAGQYNGGSFSVPLYSNFFTVPSHGGGGVNIGYLGYLVMALLLGYLIKYLFILWERVKAALGPKLDRPIAALAKKIKPLGQLDGVAVLSLLDLIVYVLIMPIVAAVVTYLAVNYLIAVPFHALADALGPVLERAWGVSPALGGLMMGAMVGFDTIGPVSASAFAVAADAAAAGNTALMTSFGLCFAATGWIPLFAWLLHLLTKKGPHFDGDDANLAMSGPINALFDNMKLTVIFSAPYACRDPFRVVPCYMLTCSLTGLLSGAAGLANTLYTAPEKLALFARGDWYTSFLQPMRSISHTPRGILMPVIVGACAILGGAVLLLWKTRAMRRQKARGTYVEINGDIAAEVFRLAKRWNEKQGQKAPAAMPEGEAEQAEAEVEV